MPEAVIVDAVRTPIGRAVQGLARRTCAPTTSPRSPLKALQRAQPRRRLRRDRRRHDGRRVRRSASRATTSAATPRCSPASTTTSPACTRQPLLRVVAADAPHGVPRDQGRRGRPVHRRRRRGRLARRAGRGIADESKHPQLDGSRGLAVRRLHPDGPDGRERRRALQRHAARRRTSGRVISQNARGRRAGERALRPRDRRRSRCPTARRASRKDDGPRPGTTLEKLAALKPVFKRGRHGHGRQRLPAQRRRRRGARHERGEGRRARPQAARADHRLDGRGDPPGDHGPRPDPGDPGAARADRHDDRRHRRRRDQRGVRRADRAVHATSSGSTTSKLNPFGGAIALGHPFGMTGARIMTTLLNDLETLDKHATASSRCASPAAWARRCSSSA